MRASIINLNILNTRGDSPFFFLRKYLKEKIVLKKEGREKMSDDILQDISDKLDTII